MAQTKRMEYFQVNLLKQEMHILIQIALMFFPIDGCSVLVQLKAHKLRMPSMDQYTISIYIYTKYTLSTETRATHIMNGRFPYWLVSKSTKYIHERNNVMH